MSIQGSAIRFPKGRMVFLARHPKKPDVHLLGFVNDIGEQTRLSLSTEAMEAICRLYTDPRAGESCAFPDLPPPESYWKQVVPADQSTSKMEPK
jgi:hypothetical protein